MPCKFIYQSTMLYFGQKNHMPYRCVLLNSETRRTSPSSFHVLGVRFSLTPHPLLSDLIYSPTATISQQRPNFYISPQPLPGATGLTAQLASRYLCLTWATQVNVSRTETYLYLPNLTPFPLLQGQGSLIGVVNVRLWCRTNASSDPQETPTSCIISGFSEFRFLQL